MMRKKIGLSFFLCTLLLLLLAIGCSIDNHLQPAVKVEDPFAIENERDFTGMVVHFFSLPNGESTFVRFPNGKTLLIDSGSAEDAKALEALLAEKKVTRIDYVLISSDQPTQAGGYPFLAEKVQIDTILMPKEIEASIRHVVKLPADKQLVMLSPGDQISFDEKIVITVLHPSKKLSLSPQDNALVFQLKQGNLRFLFTSTINEQAEEQLLENYADLLKAEVLKVADQGSNQASSQPFVSKVDPQVAIIQTGKSLAQLKAGQGEVLERLDESWAETYLTSQHGTITILSNGKQYRIIKAAPKK